MISDILCVAPCTFEVADICRVYGDEDGCRDRTAATDVFPAFDVSDELEAVIGIPPLEGFPLWCSE